MIGITTARGGSKCISRKNIKELCGKPLIVRTSFEKVAKSMTENYSKDYHNYVFKDGKFIGAFEEMYRYSAEIPWHQDETAYKVFSDIDIVILRQHRYDTVLDVGCGEGYFSERLHESLLNRGGVPMVTGIDISPTAIKKAKNLFNGINFMVLDIRKENLNKQFDLVVCKEIMWYVFSELEQVIQNLKRMTKPDGWLYISQSFPETNEYVGKEVIKSPNHLMEIFNKQFLINYGCTDWDHEDMRIRFLARPKGEHFR